MSGVTFIASEPEIGFTEFQNKHDQIIHIIHRRVNERLAGTPSHADLRSAADMLAYCNELFTSRLMKSLPPEAREAVQTLLAQSGVDGMARARAVYGVPFPAPTSHRFENPAELDAMIAEIRGETEQEVPESEVPVAARKAPNLPHDTRRDGGYL